jgi:hypothetical protein
LVKKRGASTALGVGAEALIQGIPVGSRFRRD